MRRKTLTESISALTLMFGWQEGHLAGKNGATYPRRFCSGTLEGRTAWL